MSDLIVFVSHAMWDSNLFYPLRLSGHRHLLRLKVTVAAESQKLSSLMKLKPHCCEFHRELQPWAIPSSQSRTTMGSLELVDQIHRDVCCKLLIQSYFNHNMRRRKTRRSMTTSPSIYKKKWKFDIFKLVCFMGSN